jgi:hypothetical protein
VAFSLNVFEEHRVFPNAKRILWPRTLSASFCPKK